MILILIIFRPSSFPGSRRGRIVSRVCVMRARQVDVGYRPGMTQRRRCQESLPNLSGTFGSVRPLSRAPSEHGRTAEQGIDRV
jgi:hypothetical protein